MNLISKLALGTVQFGIPYGISNTFGQTTPLEVRKILSFAGVSGIKFVDTASAYGNAEEVLGRNCLDDFQIISKYMPPNEKESIKIQLDRTLNCLNIKCLYGYLAHRPSEILRNPKEWKELERLKDSRLIVKRGFSLNYPDELVRLLDSNIEPDIIQVPFNYLDNRFETLMIEMQQRGCEIHSRSTFLQGLFFMDIYSLSDYFLEVKPILTNLQSLKVSLNGALLKFVLEKPFIDKVIIGVENVEQLKKNIQEIGSPYRLPKLGKALSEAILIPSNWPK